MAIKKTGVSECHRTNANAIYNRLLSSVCTNPIDNRRVHDLRGTQGWDSNQIGFLANFLVVFSEGKVWDKVESGIWVQVGS